MNKTDVIKKIIKKLSKNENNDEFIPVFQKLLAHLNYLNIFYHTAHWLSKSERYYADHLLFQRLYEGVEDEIDKLAERSIVAGGEDSVDRQKALDYMVQKEKEVKEMQQANKSFIDVSIKLEEDFLQMLADDTKRMSQGTQTILDDMASLHEEHLYLLTQRNKKD
jgi:DNA-binding ferritin-like protein